MHDPDVGARTGWIGLLYSGGSRQSPRGPAHLREERLPEGGGRGGRSSEAGRPDRGCQRTEFERRHARRGRQHPQTGAGKRRPQCHLLILTLAFHQPFQIFLVLN